MYLQTSDWLRGESGSLLRVVNARNGLLKFEVVRMYLYLTSYDLILETLCSETMLPQSLFPEIKEKLNTAGEADMFVTKLMSGILDGHSELDKARIRSALALLISYDPRKFDRSLRYATHSVCVLEMNESVEVRKLVYTLLEKSEISFRSRTLPSSCQELLGSYLMRSTSDEKFTSVVLQYEWSFEDLAHMLYDPLIDISVARNFPLVLKQGI